MVIVDEIDTALIAGAGRIASWCDGSFGVDQWFLARQSLTAGMAAIILNVVLTVAESFHDTQEVCLALAVLAASAFIFTVAWRELSRQQGSKLGAQTARISEYRGRHLNIAFAPLLLVDFVSGIYPIYMLGYALIGIHFFFKACTPPPPKANRFASRIHATG